MATQRGRNWSSGDIVTAANLSSIERGVSAVAEEYTPTTWANGNTVTAAGLNNIEQGIVNAGSGSSDFSTAEVTVTFDSILNTSMHGACIVEDDGDDYLDIYYPILPNTTSVITAVLYKGEGGVTIQTTGTVTVTGNIQQMSSSVYIITGDCTITISDSSGGVVQ